MADFSSKEEFARAKILYERALLKFDNHGMPQKPKFKFSAFKIYLAEKSENFKHLDFMAREKFLKNKFNSEPDHVKNSYENHPKMLAKQQEFDLDMQTYQQELEIFKQKSASSLKFSAVDGKPKKPKTSHALFVAEVKDKVKAEFPELSGAERMQMVNKIWKEMEPEDKEYYQKMYRENDRKYALEMRKYEASQKL